MPSVPRSTTIWELVLWATRSVPVTTTVCAPPFSVMALMEGTESSTRSESSSRNATLVVVWATAATSWGRVPNPRVRLSLGSMPVSSVAVTVNAWLVAPWLVEAKVRLDATPLKSAVVAPPARVVVIGMTTSRSSVPGDAGAVKVTVTSASLPPSVAA